MLIVKWVFVWFVEWECKVVIFGVVLFVVIDLCLILSLKKVVFEVFLFMFGFFGLGGFRIFGSYFDFCFSNVREVILGNLKVRCN